jgi:predicted nucleotidyltransferase
VIAALRTALEKEPRVAYALLFGSEARGRSHAHSDVDVAIGVHRGERLGVRDLGALIASLESAAGQPVDVVLLDETAPGLAYRIFRDGVRVMVRDEQALKARLVRAILEYLDFKPIEDALTEGALRVRHGR